MTEYENRKQRNNPRGYVAEYGQNGITYRLASYTPRKARPSFNWIPLILALVVLVVIAAAVILPNLTIWEDGSFRLFNLSGCFPFQLCQ